MKTKKWIALFAVVLGLTACGNPLKSLPEEGFDAEGGEEMSEEQEDLMDDILDKIKEGEYISADTEYDSVTIYKREDDDDDKEKSELYVSLTRETEYATITDYYKVNVKYSKDRGWRVKGYERDTDKAADTEVVPLKGPDDDTIKNDVTNNYLSYHDSDSGIYFQLDSTADITVESGTMTTGVGADGADVEVALSEAPEGEFNVGIPTTRSSYVTTFDYTLKSGFTHYSGTGKIGYTLNSDGSAWNYYNAGLNNDVTTELDASVAEELSEERMMADFESYDFKNDYNGNVNIRFKAKDFESCEFGECAPVENNCDRIMRAKLKDGGLYEGEIVFTFNYTYNGSTWDFNKITMKREFTYADDMKGTFSGEVYVYDIMKHDIGDKVGELTMTIDGYDKGRSVYSGHMSYVASDNTVNETMPFSIERMDDNYINISFTQREDNYRYLILSLKDNGREWDYKYNMQLYTDFKGGVFYQDSTQKHGNIYVNFTAK